MAGDSTSLPPSRTDAPAPTAGAPLTVESVPGVADAAVENVMRLSADVGGDESDKTAVTAAEIDGHPTASPDAKASSTSPGTTEACPVAGNSGGVEGANATTEEAVADGESKMENAAIVPNSTERADPKDIRAEYKGMDAANRKIHVVSAQSDADAKKEREVTAKTMAANADTVADVGMAPTERNEKPEPAAEEGDAEDKKGESDGTKSAKGTVSSGSTSSGASAEGTAVAIGGDASKPEDDQAREASTKRKNREEESTSSALEKQPAATAPAVSEDESSMKKQKVEQKPRESSAPADGADAAGSSIATPPIMISRDDMAKMEEDDGVLKFDVITNDGEAEHMVQLTTLKNIFAKQLPKMPKEYIVRLVFDRNHRSMIILKNGKHVIGGICYRPFQPNHFAEIAFCAINASDQVKGYGTRLMNHLKEYVKLQGITNFLTYADNYAIGYFKKQGFSKVVSMPRPNWFGYIKDYDGGTLMECTIHHQINYLRITSMVHKQRQAILDKIKQNSKAHIVYPGLTKFADGRLLDIYMIPGVREAGWSQATIRNNRIGTRDPGSLKTQLTQLWKAVSSHRSAWPFHEPVDTNVVVDYLDYIKEPIDLTTIGKRVESGAYMSKAQFKADLDKMCTNCTVYNLPDTNYYKAAVDLQEFVNKRVLVRDQPR